MKNETITQGRMGRNAALRFLQRKPVLWIVGIVAALLLPQVVASNYHMDIVIKVLLWGTLAEAYNISGGYGGQFSLGHSAFLALGAYASSILFWRLGVTPWVGMLVGVAVASATALLLGVVTLRLRGAFFGLSTLAFTAVTRIMATYWRPLTRGSEGIAIPYQPGFLNLVFSEKSHYYYFGLALCAGTVLVTWLISQSRLGYYLLACREDQDAAQSLGVNTTVIKTLGLMISAALTALGGTFYAQYILYIDPESLASFDMAIQFPLITVVGGVGTVAGPVLGSAVMIPLSEILRSNLSGLVSGLDRLLYGLILMLAVLFMPDGLIVEAQKWYKRLVSSRTAGGVVKGLWRRYKRFVSPKGG
jgi:branched-chain amino acid transport system permease protein